MARTANVDKDTEDQTQDQASKKNINALVSEEFRNAVESKASEQDYTISTFLSYHIQRALGMDVPAPDKDKTQEKWMLSTQVPESVKNALDKFVAEAKTRGDKTSDTVTQFLRKVAAEAVGYDLSQEPARQPGGAYIRDLQSKNAELATGMAKTFARLQAILSREEFEDAMNDAGTSYEALGLAPVEA